MSVIEELNRLHVLAKEYMLGSQDSLIRNNHMNEIKNGEVVEQRIIDAVLTDFINYIANTRCIDYCLYTCDLKENVVNENNTPAEYEIKVEYLLTKEKSKESVSKQN